MAYDTHLVARIREQSPARGRYPQADNPEVHEQAMFGGLAFLVAASGQGGLLVRVDPARVDHLLSAGTAPPMQMNGRAIHIDREHLRTHRQLANWIAIGTTTAGSDLQI